jgi:SAM-dependent methyltransferase
MPPVSFTPSGMAQASEGRTTSFGQGYALTSVDRFGVWLSARALRRHVPSFQDKVVGDFGCGYDARFVRSILGEVERAVLVDLALAQDLTSNRRVTAIEGRLPEAIADIPSGSLDVAMCVSVLEHLWEPLQLLRELRRVSAPSGVCLVNVPSWRGKRFLEYSAFRLGLSPSDEVDDHKAYYDPRDLWPLLVQAGFAPHELTCYRHKFGLNTFAACRVGE